MKTLVVQVQVGNTAAYVYDSIPDAKESAKLFRDICIPSVKRYAEKHDYDYKMITEYPEDFDITYFNRNTKSKDHDYSGGGKNKCSTLIRYLNMGIEGYDRIVSLDCDVWIPDHASPVPEVKGHAGCVDLGKPWAEFRSKYKLPHDKFINGGVQIVDGPTGSKICKFVQKKIINRDLPMIHTDQAYMNEWRSLNPDKSFVLDESWNYMTGVYVRTDDYSNVNFVHFAGGNGRGIFLDQVKRGVVK